MSETEYFDYKKVSREMGVPEDVLQRIEQEAKDEFPSDLMLFELHVLRAVKSRYWATKQTSGKK